LHGNPVVAYAYAEMSSQKDAETGPTTNFTVVTDAVSIYEGGNLTAVSITELLNNEVAVRQLINEYNQTKREIQRLEEEAQQLKMEQARSTPQPWVLISNAIVSLVGALIIGIGTNYITSDKPPGGAAVVLTLGAVLSLLTASLPVVLSLLSSRRSRK
jgi:hypothetical protein